MVKPLSFKGDKKPKKRKRQHEDEGVPHESCRPRADESTPKDAEEEASEDQSWVSAEAAGDISGPVVLVLPSSPPACIACDANGTVFAIPVENMIEGDPSTAEPHDVRQVWVASRVIGSEGFNFKGHHGRYLSCDKYGILSATASAVSAYESFLPIPTPDTPGTFSFQVAGGEKDSFLSVKEGKTTEIRGDATDVSFTTAFRVRMQARFKPRVKTPKETKALEKISRKELETAVGRKLEDHEVKRLRRARREGTYHEDVLDLRAKGKHDKFA